MKRLFALLLLWAVPAQAGYYSELDKNDIVLRVIVISDELETGETPAEQEASGIKFCEKLYGGGIWVATFADGRRKNYAGPGYKFDRELNAFVAPRPSPDAVLDRETAQWQEIKK